MTNLLLTISAEAVNWSRAQFALTAIYHWLFVPLTLGLAVVMGIMETLWVRTGRQEWRTAALFWQKLFGINFAMGVATGIILEFEFGTNWSNYSWLVGDVFGAPLAVEGIVAFFMEATFVGVMFFGWDKVSRGAHLASTWLTGLGATISAWWILVANAWMQYPVGQQFNPDTMRNEMTSFAEVALSPFAVDKFCHTVFSSWIIGAIFVAAVSCYYLMRRRDTAFALRSLRVGAAVGLAASLLAMMTGDKSAYMVAQCQPMKLAAMEALYDGGEGVSLTAVALVNPLQQPDYQSGEEPPLRISFPKMLSVLATRQADGYVPGINDLLRGGYETEQGVALSVDEKMQRGRLAREALATYRQCVADGDETGAQQARQQIADNVRYFGYGFVNDAGQVVPFIPICFWSFRVMVGLSMLFTLFFAVAVYWTWRRDATQAKWLQVAGICMLPLGYLCSESGWVLAELGRQPWAIQDMLPTWVAASDISASAIITTFFIFLALFTALLCVEVSIMTKAIRKGPQTDNN